MIVLRLPPIFRRIIFDLRDSEKKLTEAELLLQNNFIEWQSYTLQLDYATGVIGKK